MKIKLSAFYGEAIPGDVIEVSSTDGAQLIENGTGKEFEAEGAEASEPAPSSKAGKTAKTK